MELASRVWKKFAHAAGESARSKATAEKLASVKSKLSASCAECAKTCWSAHRFAKGASKVEDDVGNALTAVSGKFADATRRKILIIWQELEDVPKELLTQPRLSS